MRATNHFRLRVKERIGPLVDADDLAGWLVRSIEAGDDGVWYVGRVTRDGLRAFRFTIPEGEFVALVSTADRRCVTLLLPDGVIGRRGSIGGPIRLEKSCRK